MERDNVWQDDDSWWHQLDQEMRQREEEQERIDACNRALDELKENNDEGV